MVSIVWVLLETADIAVVKEADEQLEQKAIKAKCTFHIRECEP
ncbi:hypothetical protein SAMN05720606_12057 [Paenibacillus polysaccharolyticus]|uniref:Uncharacterized protein n=1 Tax=Paenibacillus polysaccharolyticus TaxID=582692 RepID=A0A1G5L7I8_9BACL|nr:hypothetical protein SAMN05720606_12057 [Paenibacillus polysaccharolyticus]